MNNGKEINDLLREENDIPDLAAFPLHHRRSDDCVMYLMHTLPSETFPTEPTCDDCMDLFFTNVKGPVVVSKQELLFLDDENVSEGQPDFCISAEGSAKLQELFDKL